MPKNEPIEFMKLLTRGIFDIVSEPKKLVTESFFCVIENKSHFSGFLDLAVVDKTVLTVYDKQDEQKVSLPLLKRIFNRPRKILQIVYEYRHCPDQNMGEYCAVSGNSELLKQVMSEIVAMIPTDFTTEGTLFGDSFNQKGGTISAQE